MFHSFLFRPSTHTQVRKIKVRILPTQVRTYGPQFTRPLVRILLVPILYVVNAKTTSPFISHFIRCSFSHFRIIQARSERTPNATFP